jgi:SAM-dependent methyltransferase
MDEATLQFYRERAEAYTASGAKGASRWLAGFLDLLPAGARILELGCGGGVDAAAMIAAGFDVDPVDGVPEIAAKAEARLRRPVRVMRFDALDAVDAYDAVWANASLLHVPRRDLPDVLARVRRALRPGGLHFATYKAGEAEGRDSFGRYFNYLSREEMLAAYGAPWDVVRVNAYMGGGFAGSGFAGGQGPWVSVVVRKRAE